MWKEDSSIQYQWFVCGVCYSSWQVLLPILLVKPALTFTFHLTYDLRLSVNTGCRRLAISVCPLTASNVSFLFKKHFLYVFSVPTLTCVAPSLIIHTPSSPSLSPLSPSLPTDTAMVESSHAEESKSRWTGFINKDTRRSPCLCPSGGERLRAPSTPSQTRRFSTNSRERGS
jgi:hypothetical protein